MSIKIVVDSGCDLTQEFKNDADIKVAPLDLQLGEKVFVDDDTLDTDDYVEEMVNYKGIPRTAAPSPERYMDLYKGEESVFAVTLSSKLSGSYNSARLAKDLYVEEFGEKFIHVVDSLSASVGETVIAMKLNEFIKNNFSENEILEKITGFIKDMKTFFILDRFDNLAKNGRVSPAIAAIGSILSIKPICCARDGEIAMVDKKRGYDKAVKRLLEIMKSTDVDFENRVLAISHVKCLEKALSFKDEVMKTMSFKKIIVVEASGLCSTYANKGGIIISF